MSSSIDAIKSSIVFLRVCLAMAAVAVAFPSCAEDAAPEKRTIRVLMIGNSFTGSVLRQTPALAKAEGLSLDIVQCGIGGCPLDKHWANVEKAGDAKFKPYGVSTSFSSDPAETLPHKANVTDVLVAKKWDIVTIQQASGKSAFYDTYEPYAGKLIAKIRELAPQAEIVVQETWSYSPYDPRLATWGMTPAEMHAALKKAYAQLAAKYGLRTIPTGDAVQLFRERLPVDYGKLLTRAEIAALEKPATIDFHGDVTGSSAWKLGREGKQKDWDKVKHRSDFPHLNARGHYLQACVWIGFLFGVDPTTFSYRPESLPETDAKLMRECARDALRAASGEGIEGLVHPGNPAGDLSAKPEWRKMFRTLISSADGTLQPLYWYDPDVADAVPLVVVLHSWGASCHWSSPAESVLGYCRKKGWAMLYPNFRGPNVRPEACGSDLAVEDILDAVKWAKTVRKIDDGRVYIIGGSGGGHMTLLMAGLHPEVFAGAAAFCPIADLKRWHADSLVRKNGYASKMEKSCGGKPSERPDEYARRSPLTHLHRAREAGLPVYIVTGVHDGHSGSVPVGHSIRAFNELADVEDRISEDEIAFIEENEAMPGRLVFKGEDPFYSKCNKVHLRATSAAARLTIFEGGHAGNYPAGLDFLSRQRRGAPADFTLPAAAAASNAESITK